MCRDTRIHTRDERVLIDEDPLIFYHFCGVRKPAPGLYNSSISTGISTALRNDVYRPYIAMLARVAKDRSICWLVPVGARKLGDSSPARKPLFKDLRAGERILLAPWGKVLIKDRPWRRSALGDHRHFRRSRSIMRRYDSVPHLP